jgi:hypothetical protein
VGTKVERAVKGFSWASSRMALSAIYSVGYFRVVCNILKRIA